MFELEVCEEFILSFDDEGDGIVAEKVVSGVGLHDDVVVPLESSDIERAPGFAAVRFR